MGGESGARPALEEHRDRSRARSSARSSSARRARGLDPSPSGEVIVWSVGAATLASSASRTLETAPRRSRSPRSPRSPGTGEPARADVRRHGGQAGLGSWRSSGSSAPSASARTRARMSSGINRVLEPDCRMATIPHGCRLHGPSGSPRRCAARCGTALEGPLRRAAAVRREAGQRAGQRPPPIRLQYGCLRVLDAGGGRRASTAARVYRGRVQAARTPGPAGHRSRSCAPPARSTAAVRPSRVVDLARVHRGRTPPAGSLRVAAIADDAQDGTEEHRLWRS